MLAIGGRERILADPAGRGFEISAIFLRPRDAMIQLRHKGQ